jgi:hypothetical protein
LKIPYQPSTALYDTSMSPRTVGMLNKVGIRTCGQLLDRYEGRGERMEGWNRDLGTQEREEATLVVQTFIHARWWSQGRRPS